MRAKGTKPKGLEVGNAWELRSTSIPSTNWIVGSFPTIPESSLRFMRQSNPDEHIEGATAKDIAVKWFVHSPEDPPQWGSNKPTSEGCTMSLMASGGEFELTFERDGERYILTLDSPGDFAIWGPGFGHSWRPISVSTILTVRWKPQHS